MWYIRNVLGFFQRSCSIDSKMAVYTEVLGPVENDARTVKAHK